MTKNWFETTVRYDRTMDNGLIKKSTEKYLVESFNPTEAESRITDLLVPLVSGEFAVKSVTESKFSEFIEDNTLGNDCFFSATVEFITLDEVSGKEKKVANKFLVQNNQIEYAIAAIHEFMHGCISDYNITEVKLTNIIDVYTK